MTNGKSLTAKKGLPDFLKKWATLFPLIFPELFGSTSFGIVNIVYHPDPFHETLCGWSFLNSIVRPTVTIELPRKGSPKKKGQLFFHFFFIGVFIRAVLFGLGG